MNSVLTAPPTQRTTLYYREGSSDKVYQASIEPSSEGFVVNIAYGRRGSTMSTGTKTQTPVDYETAKTIYDKLVREKMTAPSPGWMHMAGEQPSSLPRKSKP